MKDTATRNYRKQQFKKLSDKNSDGFLPSIKITRNGQETKYLSITFTELEQIKNILIKG